MSLCVHLSPSSPPPHYLWTQDEKDIVEYRFTLSRRERKWNVSHFFFCFSLPPSLLRRPPNQLWDFPRPLYNCCTKCPIVQLFFCVSLDSSRLWLFVSHEGDPNKDPSSHRLHPLTPPNPVSLFFFLDPVLFLASSVSDVFAHCCFTEFWSKLWSWSQSLNCWVTTYNVLQNQRVPIWQEYDMVSEEWNPAGREAIILSGPSCWMFNRFSGYPGVVLIWYFAHPKLV